MTSSCRSSFAQRDSAAARLVINAGWGYTISRLNANNDSSTWPITRTRTLIAAGQTTCLLFHVCWIIQGCLCDFVPLQVYMWYVSPYATQIKLCLPFFPLQSPDFLLEVPQCRQDCCRYTRSARERSCTIMGRVRRYNISFLAVGEIRDRNVV